MGLTSKTAKRRWNQHVANAKRNGPGRQHFANAIRKYGPGAFELSVLQTCETLDEANSAEAEWIKKFGTTDPERGFNIAPGGQHTPHPVASPWDRVGFREKYRTPEHRAKMVIVNTEIMNRPEVKAKLRGYWDSMWDRPGFRDAAAAGMMRPSQESLERVWALNRSRGEARRAAKFSADSYFCKRHGELPMTSFRKTYHGGEKPHHYLVCKVCERERPTRRKN